MSNEKKRPGHCQPPRTIECSDTSESTGNAMRLAAMAKEISDLRTENANLRRNLEGSQACRDRETAIRTAIEKERDRLEAALVHEFQKHIMDALKEINFDPGKNVDMLVDTVAAAILEKAKLHPDMLPEIDVRVENKIDQTTGDVNMEIVVSTDDPFLIEYLRRAGFKIEELTHNEE